MTFSRGKFKGIWIVLTMMVGAHPALARTFRVGTYNIENLWDHIPDNTSSHWTSFKQTHPDLQYSKRSPQYDDYSLEKSNWYDPKVLTNKVEQVVEGIRLAGSPDILGVQEIESAGNQSQVLNIPCGPGCTLQSRLEKLGYRYFIIGPQNEDNPVSVTTGFFSKIPLQSLESVNVEFSRYSTSARDVQVVETYIEDSRLVIFNGHFKSKRGDGGESFRIQTAQAIRERMEEEKQKDPLTRFIVLGDLNSGYKEAPLRALMASSQKEQLCQNQSPHLYNLWYELAPEDRWEHTWDGHKSVLSHILISDSFFYNQGLQYVDDSFQVVGHQGEAREKMLGPDSKPFRWQITFGYNYSKHRGKGFSDHLPMVATFEYDPEKSNQVLSKRTDVADKQWHETTTINQKLPKIERCQEEDTIKIEDVKIDRMDDLEGLCVRIDFSDQPQEVKAFGRFQSNAIEVNVNSTASHSQDVIPVQLALTMTRGFDWRPNLDDPRVHREQVEAIDKGYHARNPHPHSNKCFLRGVLQGKGGKLVYAIGKIGYANGYLSLFIVSRHQNDLLLTELPARKRQACQW